MSKPLESYEYTIDEEGNFKFGDYLICQVIFKDYQTLKEMQAICDTLNNVKVKHED